MVRDVDDVTIVDRSHTGKSLYVPVSGGRNWRWLAAVTRTAAGGTISPDSSSSHWLPCMRLDF